MHHARVLVCALVGSTSLSIFASWSGAQSALPAVFVTNNVGDSVTSFTVNPNGSLNRVNTFAAGDGPQTISLSPDGRYLAVANGTISQTVEELRIFEVNSDATLTPRLLTTVLDSPLDVQWMNNSALAVTRTTSGGNTVRTFSWDGTTFAPVDTEPTGSFNSRLATARNGSLLYANNTSGGNSIFAFAAAGNGALTAVDNESTGSLFATDITASRDGRHLYGSGGISGGGHAILGFNIDGSGALTPTAASPYNTPGTSPKVVVVTEDDKLVVAGHGTDATVRTFMRNSLTGDLTATPFFFDAGDQGNLGDIKTMGNLLFVSHSFSDTVGTGVWSFTINPDGSLTQNGPIVDSLGSRPEYLATWQGVPEPAASLSATVGLAVLMKRRRREASRRCAAL